MMPVSGNQRHCLSVPLLKTCYKSILFPYSCSIEPKAIETNTQGVISQMDAQHELYKASKCGAVAADAGSTVIKRNINESYIEMLTRVEASLPTVESAMTKIKAGMESSLRSKIGLGMSPRELPAHITGKRSAINKDRPGRKRTANLSSVFAKYHQLVSTNWDGGERGQAQPGHKGFRAKPGDDFF